MDFEALYDELRTVLADVWPEVVNGDGGRRIFEAEHVTSIAFEQIVTEHGLPFAVIVMPPLEPAEWSADSRSYETDVSLYLVRETNQGAEGLRPSLEALCAYLWTTELTQAQVIVDPFPEWGMSLEINQVLRTKKVPGLAGRVVAPLVLGETP